jgi:hypothetical protein
MRFVARQNYYCIDYCALWRASKVPLDFFKIPPCGELLFLQKKRFVARQNYYCIDYCAVWRASKVPLDFFLILPCGKLLIFELLILGKNAPCGAAKLAYLE